MFTPSSAGQHGRPSSASTTTPPGPAGYPPVPLPQSSSHNSLFSLSSHSRQPSHNDLNQQTSTSPMSLQKMHTLQHLHNEPEQHVSHTHTHTAAAAAQHSPFAAVLRPLILAPLRPSAHRSCAAAAPACLCVFSILARPTTTISCRRSEWARSQPSIAQQSTQPGSERKTDRHSCTRGHAQIAYMRMVRLNVKQPAH